MGSALDILEAVNPPRAAFLDYLLGHTAGKPFDRDLQRAIAVSALDAFNSLDEPGQIERLPFYWGDDDTWKDGVMNDGDSRTSRSSAPQYQREDDRLLAESDNAGECQVCEVSS